MFIHLFFTPIFFTPKSQPSLREKLINIVDSYFHIHGSILRIDKPSNSSKPFVYNVIPTNMIFTSQNQIQKSLIFILKIISYTSLIIPLIMLAAKYLLRQPYTFISLLTENPTPIDQDLSTPKKLFQKIEVSNNSAIKKQFIDSQNLAKITNILPSVLPLVFNKQKDSDIFSSYIFSKNAYVFELKEFPDLVFKTEENNEELQLAFANMKMVENLIKTRGYDKVIVPHAEILQITLPNNKIQFCIVKEKIKFPKKYNETYLGWPITPEAYGWLEHDEELRPAIIQTSYIIQESGLSDFYYRNAPAIKQDDEWKICLLETDSFRQSPQMTRYNLLQLIQCSFSEKSMHAIIDSCKAKITPKKQIKTLIQDLENKKRKHSTELLKIFADKKQYQEMQIALGNINNPFKPIVVDIPSLGLDLTQTALTPNQEKISIKDFLFTIIASLNKELEIKSKEPIHQYDNHQYDLHRLINFPIYSYNKKEKDYIPNTSISEYSSDDASSLLNLVGLNFEEKKDFIKKITLIKKQLSTSQNDQCLKYQKQTWLCQIFTALQQQGYIFSSGYSNQKETYLLLSPHFKVRL